MSICPENEALDCESGGCPAEVVRYADVSLPIAVQPYAALGEVETACCGTPTVVVSNPFPCSGNCGCDLVVTQRLRIRIPIEFGATVEAESASAICRGNSGVCCE